MNDPGDRWIDVALHELHGVRPPDLSARVLLALQEPAAGALPRLAPGRATRRPLQVPLAAFWLLAVLLGGSTAWIARSMGGGAPLPVAAPLAIDVLAGEVVIESVGSGESQVLGLAPVPAPVHLERGDRLRTAAASSFRLQPFGLLVTTASTVLEVQTMEVSLRAGVVAASSLTVAVVAGVVTWQTMANTGTAAAGDTLRLEAGGEAAALAAENARLRQRIGELERERDQRDQRRHDAERTPAVPPLAGATAATPAANTRPEGALATGPTFVDPPFEAALRKIDWATLGAVSNEMAPLLVELAEALVPEGAEVPMALAIRLQSLNAVLAEQIPAILEAGIPGFGPNGSYTHPLVAANAMASALAAAGQPLTADQQAKIDGLVRAFSRESRAIADAAPEVRLEALLAEVEMKDRFYREVGSLLAPGQQGTLWRDGAAAYEGTSLFDVGVVLQAHADPVPAADAQDFARIASRRLADRLGLDEAAATKVCEVLANAASAPELWRDRAAPIETSSARLLQAGRTRTALRHQIAWTRQILAQVPLTAEQRQKLLAMGQVLVPLPR